MRGSIQVSGSVAPGMSLAPWDSTVDGNQYSLDLEVRLWQGNWWVWAAGQWAGYYPLCNGGGGFSPCSGATLFSAAGIRQPGQPAGLVRGGLRFLRTRRDDYGHGQRPVRQRGLGEVRVFPDTHVLLAASDILVVGLWQPVGHRLGLLASTARITARRTHGTTTPAAVGKDAQGCR